MNKINKSVLLMFIAASLLASPLSMAKTTDTSVSSQLKAIADKVNSQVPIKINDKIQIDKASFDQAHLQVTIFSSFTEESAQQIKSRYSNKLAEEMQKSSIGVTCKNSRLLNLIKQQNASINYVYYSKDKKEVASFNISKKDCK